MRLVFDRLELPIRLNRYYLAYFMGAQKRCKLLMRYLWSPNQLTLTRENAINAEKSSHCSADWIVWSKIRSSHGS
jgi:hypothetical protein